MLRPHFLFSATQLQEVRGVSGVCLMGLAHRLHNYPQGQRVRVSKRKICVLLRKEEPLLSMWLHWIAIACLSTGVLSTLVIAADILNGRRQKMWIMDVVWPVTGLYAGVFALWAYFKVGRMPASADNKKPMWQSVGIGALHCGSGCSLGDLAAEWLVVAFPFTIAGHKLFGSWIIDYIFAFAFGIAFQYFSIKPMRNLSAKEALKSALKADSASLTAWQVGMYGWMAISVFLIFGRELEKTDPVFWFMMQIGMLAGFLTSYPVNWWLISKGVKEKM